MSSGKATSWAYAEAYPREDDVLLRARERSMALRLRPVTPAVAATLTVLAAAVQPRAAVEVGTGAGVSGAALLRGMPRDSVLTTIDTDIRALRAARETFREVGAEGRRVRTISGRASLVLPRLSAGSYDLVLLDAEPSNTLLYVDEAVRLLRTGGTLIVHDALDQDRVPNPVEREDSTRIHREIHRMLREDERFVSTVLTPGAGMLVAVRR
ncbi:O-methyltransferase [Kocuria palustris]|uniref:O-methyltransferase n=1 Tax=Kocuria palustris TaxID=71999 RepID=UPI0011A0C22C|nr:class I SAM-dependent methyltransferase [Kocuria palustris]